MRMTGGYVREKGGVGMEEASSSGCTWMLVEFGFILNKKAYLAKC